MAGSRQSPCDAYELAQTLLHSFRCSQSMMWAKYHCWDLQPHPIDQDMGPAVTNVRALAWVMQPE